MAKKRHNRDIENMSDVELVNLVVSDFNASESHTSERRSKYEEWTSQYRSLTLPENIRPHGANIYVPYTFQLVETAVPKWFNALFGSKPYTTILPAGEFSPEQMEKAKKLQALITYQLDQKIKIVSIGDEAFKSVAILGTAITKQDWVTKKRKMKVKEQGKLFGVIPMPGTINVKEAQVTIKDDPSMRVVPMQSFRYDPTGTTIETCNWCGEDITISLGDLRAKIENNVYKSTPELTQFIKDMEGSDANTTLGKLDNGNPESRKKKDIQVFEYYTDEYVVHVIDKRFIALKEKNPYFHGEKPYVKWVAIPIMNCFEGIGIPESVESLQHELNTTRNQRIDNVSMAINRMWKVLRGSGIREDQLISRPNGVIYVDDMEDLEELSMNMVTGNAYDEENTLKQDMDMASGVLDSIRGTSTDRRETATTASIMHQSGGDRFKYETILLDVMGLSQAVGQILALNQQFITEDAYLNIYGQDESVSQIKISPDDLIGKFDVVTSSAGVDPAANKEVMRNQLTTVMQTLQGNMWVNEQALTKRYLEAFDMKNVDELILTPEEMAQKQAEAQMAEQPQAMQPGMDMGMMSTQAPQQMISEPQVQDPLQTATPAQLDMVMKAIETNSELPPELLPLAQALVAAMEQEAKEAGQ